MLVALENFDSDRSSTAALRNRPPGGSAGKGKDGGKDGGKDRGKGGPHRLSWKRARVEADFAYNNGVVQKIMVANDG